MLLQLFPCGVSLPFLTRPSDLRDLERWMLAGLVVLYNPIAPIELGSKLRWSIINIATVVTKGPAGRSPAGPTMSAAISEAQNRRSRFSH